MKSILLRPALEEWVCDALIRGFEEHPELHTTGDTRAYRNKGFNELTCAPIPKDMPPIFEKITDIGVEHLGIPVDHSISSYSMGRYEVGGAQTWHADYDPTHELGGRRTLSWSLLLSKPGIDFAGGELELETGVVDLRKGEACIFSAHLRHQVRPITDGIRYVVICFAGA